MLGLAASQDLLTDRNWRGVPLEALVRAQAAAVSGSREKRFVSEGPMILLSPHATQTLGLALHELCDNALKHGALSNDDGDVSLVWRIDESGAEPNFEMTWRERGGPPVNATPISGFGSVVLERLTAAGLNASSTLSFEVDGVTWRLIAPLKEIGEDRKRRLASPGAVGSSRIDLTGGRDRRTGFRLSSGGFSCRMGRASRTRTVAAEGGSERLPMPEKTPGQPRKRARRPPRPARRRRAPRPRQRTDTSPIN